MSLGGRATCVFFLVAFGVGNSTACAQRAQTEIASDRFASLVQRYQSQVPLWKLLRASSGARPSYDDAVARSRLRGLMPQLRVGARLSKGNDFLQVQADDSGRLNLSSDEQLTLDFEVRFSLDRLLYDRAEPALLREQAAREQQWRADRETIVELYMEWVRLSAERDYRGVASMSHHSRINLVAARLNLFTGGNFFRMLRARPHE